MNKPYLWFFVVLMFMGIAVLFFDAYLQFSYINSHNSSTYNNSNYNKIPQIIPSLPNQLVQPIILAVGLTIVVIIFVAIWRYFTK